MSERDRTFGAQAQAARLDPLRHYRSCTRAGVSVADSQTVAPDEERVE